MSGANHVFQELGGTGARLVLDGWRVGRRVSGLREQWEYFAKRIAH